jgi:predicted RNA-binding protein with RPS1 domain
MSAGAACAAGSVGLRGPKVFVKVISVDEASGKISLSMKPASQGDW